MQDAELHEAIIRSGIQKLSLETGDIVLVKCAERVPADVAARLGKEVHRYVPDHKVVVVCSGVDLERVSAGPMDDFAARASALEAYALSLTKALTMLAKEAHDTVEALRAGQDARRDRARMDESVDRIAASCGESPGDGYMLSPAESRAALDAMGAASPAVGCEVTQDADGAVLRDRFTGRAVGGLIVGLDPEGVMRYALEEVAAAFGVPPEMLKPEAPNNTDLLNGLTGMGTPIGRGMYWTDEIERADGRAPLRTES